MLSLETCYNFLFNEEEREHLTYDGFVEDWPTFLDTNSELDRCQMSSVTALRFLAEMQ